MPPRPVRTPKLEQQLPPILALLTENPPNAYSAHQKALTTTARLVQSGHGPIAIDILFQVARELLKLGEAASGVELGVRMVEIMGETKVPVEDSSKAKVTQLLPLTPPTGPWRKKLADAALKWSAAGGCPSGDPALNQYLGELNFKDRLFESAEQYLLNAGKRDSAVVLADLMYEWSNRGAEDPAPYAVRGVLPWLGQAPPNILAASTFLSRFLGHLRSRKDLFLSDDPNDDLTISPMINFLHLAIATVQRAPAPGASAVQARGTDGGTARDWQQLVARYRRVSPLMKDNEIVEAIEHISSAVFLIPSRSGGNDMLQNLMGSLFGGGGMPQIGR